MKEMGSKEKILDTLNLNFHNQKYESEYEKKNSKLIKERNVYFTMLNLIFSTILLVFFTCLVVEVNNIYSKLSIKLRRVSEVDPKKARTYYNSYIVVNEEAEDVISEADYSYSVRQYLFAKGCLPLMVTLFLIYSAMFLMTIFVKNDRMHRLISLISYGLFGMNFHIISGILRSFFHLSSDPIFFVVAVQLFFRIMIVFKIKMRWCGVMVVSAISICSQWSLFLAFHYRAHLTIVYYFSVDTLIQLSTIFLAYYDEVNSKFEFFLLRRMNFDKEYLVNFLYFMGQGFFTYSGGKVIFINDYMKKIISNYEIISSCNNFCSGNIVNSNSPKSNNGNYINNYSNRLFLNYDVSINDPDESTNFLNTHFLPSKYNNLSLQSIEAMMENVFEINPDLPNEIQQLFYFRDGERGSSTNINFSNYLNNSSSEASFKLEKLFNVMRNLEQFKKFTTLGKLKFNLKNNSVNNEFLENIVNKQYEISARVITHDITDEFMEFIFTDVSNVIKIEREKTITSCRSMYLSKIAHEFKNPISSLIELSTRIKEESDSDLRDGPLELPKSNKIAPMADYSISICKIMDRFLNDFSIFTNLKIPCNKCSKLKDCEICLDNHFCRVCGICQNCEKHNQSNFNYKKILSEFIDTFKSLNHHEGKNHRFIFDTKNCSSGNRLIRSNKDVFYSIIYNLLYHSYKAKNKSEICIKIDEVREQNEVKFEIYDSSLEINKKFIEDLHNLKFKFEDNHDVSLDEMNSDRFNKFFKIYIAFCLVRKLGSNLKIESENFITKYSFTLKSAIVSRKQTGETARKLSLNRDDLLSPKESRTNSVSIIFFDKNSEFSREMSMTESSCEELYNNLTKIYELPMSWDYNYELQEIVSPKTINTTSIPSTFDSNVPSNFASFSKSNSISDGQSLTTAKSKAPCDENIIRILVIDDEKVIRDAMKRHFKNISVLDSMKFEIEFKEAENCFEALETIYHNFQNNIFFNFVIIDEFMPYMKGSTMIRLLKQLYNENNFYKMTFISYTSFEGPEKKKFIFDQGADYVLNKPITFESFSEFMKTLMKKHCCISEGVK